MSWEATLEIVTKGLINGKQEIKAADCLFDG